MSVCVCVYKMCIKRRSLSKNLAFSNADLVKTNTLDGNQRQFLMRQTFFFGVYKPVDPSVALHPQGCGLDFRHNRSERVVLGWASCYNSKRKSSSSDSVSTVTRHLRSLCLFCTCLWVLMSVACIVCACACLHTHVCLRLIRVDKPSVRGLADTTPPFPRSTESGYACNSKSSLKDLVTQNTQIYSANQTQNRIEQTLKLTFSTVMPTDLSVNLDLVCATTQNSFSFFSDNW